MDTYQNLKSAYVNYKRRKRNVMDFKHRVLPFYMAYPNIGADLTNTYQQEDTVMRDLEYLQQLYPEDAKRYQARISRILDKMDYEGSMIYDEYPDKFQLYNLADNILLILKREDEEAAIIKGEEMDAQDKQKWEWLTDLIRVLLFYEIYRRRHRTRRGYLKF